MVLQGGVWPQLGTFWPVTGSTETAISAAAAPWRHDAQHKKTLMAETATLRCALPNGVRMLSLLALQRRITCIAWRTAATRMKMAPKT
jgi:hypothetical protein